MLKKLIKGKTVELHIKGFASPLHDKQYNINLSKRRISSLMNLISSFENGQLKNYIATGKLKIIKLPLGETKSKTFTKKPFLLINLKKIRQKLFFMDCVKSSFLLTLLWIVIIISPKLGTGNQKET